VRNLKILILEVRDTGGTGYTLAHAINKQTSHHAVNLRAQKSFINYPAIANMGDYNVPQCKRMVQKADVLVFNGVFKPFYDAFDLNPKELKDKKKVFLCMGSEWRWGRKQLIEEADKLMKDYQIVLGGSGMFLPNPEHPEEDSMAENAEFLPVVRSFDEALLKYSSGTEDREAMQNFGTPKKRVIFTHAPTSEAKKGSRTFHHVVTQAMQAVPQLTYQTIRRQSWTTTLQLLGQSDLLFDQDPPFPVGYGAISVEACIFSVPVVTRVDSRCREWIRKKTGLNCPFISWDSHEDLYMKVLKLATEPKYRTRFGALCHSYGRQLHDEKPVVDRFMKILNKM